MCRSNMFLLLFLTFLFSIVSYSPAQAQKKMYAWPPKSQKFIQSDILTGKSVSIEIKDARIISPNSKIKASFGQISSALIGTITQTYGKSFIDKSSDIKIVITLVDYDATFYTGMWHAQTRYIVRIGEEEEVIEQISNQFNVGGTSSGKKALANSFGGANMNLFRFLTEKLK